VIGWENSPILDRELKRLADTDAEIIAGIGIDETFSVNTRELECLGEHFSNRECSSFMLCLRVITGISENSVDFSENELGTVSGEEFRFFCLGKELRENLQ